jgi:putative protease
VRILSPVAGEAEVPALLEAGADEFYCGYYPTRWFERWGRGAWPNRRGPGPANMGSADDVRGLVRAAEQGPRRAPVYVTMNQQYHTDDQADLLVDEARRCAEAGAGAVIVSDPALMLRLREEVPALPLFASTVAVVLNADAVRFFVDLGCQRVIVSRHLDLTELAPLVAAVPEVEIEAFILNDNCWFEEGLCSTLHSLPGFGVYCMTPWEIEVRRDDRAGAPISDPEERARWDFVLDEHQELLRGLGTRGTGAGRVGLPLGPCGLCALPELFRMGTHSVKIVGREANLYRKIRSVQVVRHLRDLVAAGGSPREVKAAAVELRGDPSGCAAGTSCYYRGARERDLIPAPGRTRGPRRAQT